MIEIGRFTFEMMRLCGTSAEAEAAMKAGVAKARAAFRDFPDAVIWQRQDFETGAIVMEIEGVPREKVVEVMRGALPAPG
jgi:flavin-binding protein dodecin